MAKLPKYKITIDPAYSNGEDLGIEQIAFTANPAIKVKGMAFNAVETKKQFYKDEVKMRIVAPALIPMEIYRNDEDGEYFVEFTADEVEALASKFMSNLSNKDKFNLEHNDNETVPAYILETWIVDNPKQDKAWSSYGIDVPKGTLMVVTQLTDKTYYTSLVENDQVGYSIEGFLGLKLSDLQTAKELITNKNKLTIMKKKILSKTLKPKFELTLIKQVETYTLDVDNTSFAVGDKITTTDSVSGTVYPICDGEYQLEDGTCIFTDSDGVIVFTRTYTDTPATTPTDTAAADEAPVKDEVKPADKATDKPVEDPKKDEVKAEDAPVAKDEKKYADAPVVDEAAIMAIVQPKLDEIYKMLADLKAADAEEDATETDSTTVNASTKMSIHDRFAQVMKIVGEK